MYTLARRAANVYINCDIYIDLPHLTSINSPCSPTSHPSKERPGKKSNKRSRWTDHPTSRQGGDCQRRAGRKGCCATCVRKSRDQRTGENDPLQPPLLQKLQQQFQDQLPPADSRLNLFQIRRRKWHLKAWQCTVRWVED